MYINLQCGPDFGFSCGRPSQPLPTRSRKALALTAAVPDHEMQFEPEHAAYTGETKAGEVAGRDRHVKFAAAASTGAGDAEVRLISDAVEPCSALACDWCGRFDSGCQCERGLMAYTGDHRGCSVAALDERPTSRQDLPSQRNASSPFVTSDSRSELRPTNTDFIHQLIAGFWPNISKWFENKLRSEVEPLLQSKLPRGMSCRFGKECHLGNEPCRVHDVSMATYVQSSATEREVKNLRAIGDLDYVGDCVIEVEASVGKVVMTGIQVMGTVVLEFVDLNDAVPFFNGIRIYFANMPTVDLKVNSNVLGVEVNFKLIKDMIVKTMREVIAKMLVLPHQFAVSLKSDFDVFPLKCTRPQGILRLAVVSARGLKVFAKTWRTWAGRSDGPHGYRFGDVTRTMYRATMGQRSDEPGEDDASLRSDKATEDKIAAFVSVAVGAREWTTDVVKGSLNPTWGEASMEDFLVTDCQAQLVSIEVRDQTFGFLGSVEINVSDLVGLKDAKVLQAGRWFQLTAGPHSSETRGRIQLRCEWRTFPSLKDLSPTPFRQRRLSAWTLGESKQSTWMLFVGLYYATALPPVAEGTEHWATISVDDGTQNAEGPSRCQQSPVATACTPLQKSLQVLQSQLPWIPKEVMAEAISSMSGKVHAHLLRRGARPARDGLGEALVDADWQWSCFFLLENVDSAVVNVSVSRPTKGLKRPTASTSRPGVWSRMWSRNSDPITQVGSASYSLRELRKHTNYTTTLDLPLQEADDATAASVVRLRLQIRPVVVPPADVPAQRFAPNVMPISPSTSSSVNRPQLPRLNSRFYMLHADAPEADS